MLAQSHSLEAVGRYQGPSGVLSRPLCPSRSTHQGWECLELLLRFRIRVYSSSPAAASEAEGRDLAGGGAKKLGAPAPTHPQLLQGPSAGCFQLLPIQHLVRTQPGGGVGGQ